MRLHEPYVPSRFVFLRAAIGLTLIGLLAAWPRPAFGQKCAGGPGSCLDVLTYNAKFFVGTGGKNPKKRARKMIDWIARPDKQAGSKVSSLTGPVDVVVINELVLNGPESILRNKLSNKYGYNMTKKEMPHTTSQGKLSRATEGGVTIFSRHKIKKENYIVFSIYALAGISVAHGVVHAEIEKGKGNNRQNYHIFATHFDTVAGKKDCKKQENGWKRFQKKSVRELKKFVKRKAGGEPAIIAGDLNFGVGLQNCSINQRAFKWTLKHLGAVEPAHPEDTEVGKDFSANKGKLSSNSDAGRVLDHIMVRNFPRPYQSSAKRLWFKASSSKIGIGNGHNLSDHHPVYAFLQTCELPKISSTKTTSAQQGGTYSLTPTLELELNRAPSCALRVQWEVAPSSSFKKIVYSTSGKLRKKSASLTVPYGKLAPSTTYHWRARVTLPRAKWSGSRHRWPPNKKHTNSKHAVVWNPNSPRAPGASSKKGPFASRSEKQSFTTLSFEADTYERKGNDNKNKAPTPTLKNWNHKHMICPNGAVVPTKTSGKCAGIFTTTKNPGTNAPLVAYEKWTMKKSNLTLQKKDVDNFKVRLPKLHFNNSYVKRELKNNPCATLKVKAQKRKQPNRKIRSSPEFITSVYPDKSSRSKGYKLNDPLSVSVKEPKIECKKWVNKKGEEGPKYIKIGKKGNHWGGYQLRLEISIRLAHKKYEQAVAAEKAQWRDVTRMERLQMAGPLRDLVPDPEDCSGPVCRLKFPNPVGLQPGEKPFPGGPDCRVCQEGMLFRVKKAGLFEMAMQAPAALDFRLLDASGKVVAEASRVAEPGALRPVETTAAQASARPSTRTDVRKRISVERLEPGQYMLLLEGPPSIWRVEALTLPSKGKSEDQSVQQVTEPGGLEVTALAKAGTFLPGVSTFEDLSGAAGSALGGQQSVFTWGGSVAFGARNGPLNLRLTGLRTTGSLISTSEGVEAAEGPVREKMTLLTGEVVLRPIPRLLVQPYAIGGVGARRLSVRRFDELSGGPRWDAAAQVGVGADIRVGPVTLGVEVVDYLTGLRGDGGLQHDAFGFLTFGVPLR